jgi:hypothetical protein
MKITIEEDRIILADLDDVHSLTLPPPVTPPQLARVLPIDDLLVVLVETPDPGVIPVTDGEAATVTTEFGEVVVDLVRDRQAGTADPDQGVPNETGVVVATAIVIIVTEVQAVIVNTAVRNLQT